MRLGFRQPVRNRGSKHVHSGYVASQGLLSPPCQPTDLSVRTWFAARGPDHLHLRRARCSVPQPPRQNRRAGRPKQASGGLREQGRPNELGHGGGGEVPRVAVRVFPCELRDRLGPDRGLAIRSSPGAICEYLAGSSESRASGRLNPSLGSFGFPPGGGGLEAVPQVVDRRRPNPHFVRGHGHIYGHSHRKRRHRVDRLLPGAGPAVACRVGARRCYGFPGHRRHSARQRHTGDRDRPGGVSIRVQEQRASLRGNGETLPDHR